jgi:hypothetical protein
MGSFPHVLYFIFAFSNKRRKMIVLDVPVSGKVIHSLFFRWLAFFRFNQDKGQSMSDAVNDLQRLGDQSDLGGLHPADSYVMLYFTITDNPDLLDKLLEIEAPT